MTADSNDERHLVQQAIDGDQDALAELFQRHRTRLKRMVRLRMDRRLRGRVDAADVLQEAFFDLARRIGDYDLNSDVPFFVWLRLVALQRLAQIHRRHLGTAKRDANMEVSLYRKAWPQASTEFLASQLLGKFTSVSERDIKPSNLLLDTRGTVWVTDFGLAKAEDQQDLTHSGDILGTLRYMAPESLNGKTDARSDVYSLGLTLYELAALRPAFASTNRHAMIRDITDSAPPPLARANQSVPKDLATVIHKAIEREPQHRYATAQDLADDLQRVLDDRPVHARRVTLAERLVRWSRRNKPLAASLLATASLLLLVAIGGVAMAIHESSLRDDAQQSRDIAQQSLKRAEDLTEELTQDKYATSMVIGGEAYQRPSGGVAMRRNLDLWRPASTVDTDRRGWEWFFLDSSRQANRSVVFDIIATAFDWHPNGDWLAFSGSDGMIRVWTGGARENIIRVMGHTGPVRSIQWSPDGKLLATAGLDGRLLIWKAEDWSCLYSLSGRSHIQWSPNGVRIAVTDGKTVRIWDVSTGQEERSFEVAGTNCLCWNQDGTRLAFNDGDDKVRIWNVDSETNDKQPVIVWKNNAVQSVHQLAWNHKGELEVVTQDGNVCRILTIKAGKLLRTQLVAEDMPNFQEARLSPMSDTWAISGFTDFSNAENVAVTLFDPETARSELLVGHRVSNALLAWHPGGRLLATTCRDRTLRIWDTQTSTQLRLFRLPAGGGPMKWNSKGDQVAIASTQLQVFDANPTAHGEQLPPNTPSFSISPNGRTIALGDLGNRVRFWDLFARKEMLGASLPIERPVHRVTYSPNGKMLAAAIGDGRTIVIWDLNSKKVIGRYQRGEWIPVPSRVWLSWSPDSKQLAATGGGGDGVHIITMYGKRIRVIRCDRGRDKIRQTCLAWAPYGSTIISLPGSHFAELLDAQNPDPENPIRLDGHEQWERDTSWLWHAAFSPDGKQVVTSSLMGTLRIWDVATHAPVRTLRSQDAEGADVCWSPDGRRIASGDSDGGLKIWDAATGRELLSIRIGEGSVNKLAWTPDGSRIVANVYGGEGDGCICIERIGNGTDPGKHNLMHAELLSHLGTSTEVGRIRWGPKPHGQTRDCDQGTRDTLDFRTPAVTRWRDWQAITRIGYTPRKVWGSDFAGRGHLQTARQTGHILLYDGRPRPSRCCRAAPPRATRVVRAGYREVTPPSGRARV